MKIQQIINFGIFLILCEIALGDGFVRTPPRYLSFLKRADISGIGTVLDLNDGVMRIEVNDYWLGDRGTNVIDIHEAFSEFLPETNSIIGHTAVFFAVTNQWKGPFYSPTLPMDFEESWEFSLALTNCGPVCPPKFSPSNFPPLFIIGINDVQIVNFLSNFVESVFITRDHNLYYRTLRDALHSQSSSMKECGAMSFLPMYSVLAHADETNLVEMLYDPFLVSRFRNDALFYLKKKYNWPATNTVPEL